MEPAYCIFRKHTSKSFSFNFPTLVYDERITSTRLRKRQMGLNTLKWRRKEIALSCLTSLELTNEETWKTIESKTGSSQFSLLSIKDVVIPTRYLYRCYFIYFSYASQVETLVISTEFSLEKGLAYHVGALAPRSVWKFSPNDYLLSKNIVDRYDITLFSYSENA